MPDVDYVPADFFILRTAAVPLRQLNELDAVSAPDRSAALRRHFSDELSDALWLASPGLASTFKGDASDDVDRALYRYFIRAATRCNPFGEFASVGTGSIAATTCLSGNASYQRIVRLDGSVIQKSCGTERSWAYLTTPWYPAGKSFRYFAAGATQILTEIEATAVLEHVAASARDGCEIAELVRGVARFAQASEAEAAAYVNELLDSGVLCSLQPRVTGDPAFAEFERELSASDPGAGRRFTAACAVLTRIGAEKSPLRDAAAQTLAALGVAEHRIEEVLQVDLVRSADSLSLSSAIAAEIGRGAIAMLLLQPRATGDEDPLDSFRERFSARYGDAAVPLLTALDPDCGIPLTAADADTQAPLLEGFPPGGEPVPYRWSFRERDLIERAAEIARSGAGELVFSDEDVSARAGSRKLPESFSALCAIVAGSPADVQRGAYTVVMNAVSGGSGTRLFGRFCGVIPGLTEHVRRFAADSDQNDSSVVSAEIVFSPSGREANVIRRDRVREAEIPILTRGNPSQTIRPEDLDLFLRDGTFVLWDRTRAVRVRPRLNIAHNFTRPSQMPLYRFLGFLEEEGSPAGGMWEWGLLATSPFLPRVRFGKCILARARWRLPRDVVDISRKVSRQAAGDILRRWKEQARCPDHVMAGDLDTRVILNLTTDEGLSMLARLIRGSGVRELFEALPDTHNEAVVLNGEAHAHEFVVPFRRVRTSPPVSIKAAPPFATARSLGERWSFVKIYVNPGRMNELLGPVGAAFADEIARGRAAKWFYIRYADPEWHLRLRFQAVNPAASRAIVAGLKRRLRAFLLSGVVWRVETDSYLPEITRYGGIDAIEHVETMFWRDSEAAVRLIAVGNPDGGGEAIPDWLMCMQSVDALCKDAGWQLDERLSFVRARRDAHVGELGSERAFREHASRLSRQYLPLFRAALSAESPVQQALSFRSADAARMFVRLRECHERGSLTRPVAEIAGSIAHMTANRVLRCVARARVQEAFIFDLLARAYDGERARRGTEATP